MVIDTSAILAWLKHEPEHEPERERIVATLPFDERRARLADAAFLRYGKGQGHSAQLNFGDCAVDALARSLDEPLLFVGNDFAQTDLLRC